jgi:DNA-binding XRE family transcriptional regulator
MAKVGRPTAYNEEYCEMLIEHMKKGLSFESFAGVVGVANQTIYNWEKEFPEFLEAKRIGTGYCRLFYEQAGVDGLWEKEEYDVTKRVKTSKKINDRIWRLNMANRFGWRENQTLQEKIVEKRLIIQNEPEEPEDKE